MKLFDRLLTIEAAPPAMEVMILFSLMFLALDFGSLFQPAAPHAFVGEDFNEYTEASEGGPLIFHSPPTRWPSHDV